MQEKSKPVDNLRADAEKIITRAIAAVLPDGSVLHTEETMEGRIAGEAAGSGGFGYDPILWLPEFGKTSAEITMDEKNRISHRGKALRAMREALVSWLGKDKG